MLHILSGVFVSLALIVTAQDPCSIALANCGATLETGGQCSCLPIPEAALSPAIRSPEGYNLEEIRPGVFTVHDGIYFAMIIKRNDTVALVDFPENGFIIRDETGVPVGSRMVTALREILAGAIPAQIEMIYSHGHLDHIGTAALAYNALSDDYPEASLRIWASTASAQDVANSVSGRAPPPTDVVEKSKILRLGRGFEIQMLVVNGHSGGDLLVYVSPLCEAEGVVFLVDLVFPGWAPFFRFAITENLLQYIEAHDQVLGLDFETFVGGHLTRLGTRADVELNRELTMATIQAGQEAMEEFTPADSPDDSGNLWKSFGRFREGAAALCARKVLPKFGCKLAGLDVVLPSLCETAMDFIRIDR